jgi:choline dehydrogenase-like flavoprotein
MVPLCIEDPLIGKTEIEGPMKGTVEYDYIIAGTGPAGATLARDLARGGKTVCLVETGGRMTRTGFRAVGPRIETEKNIAQWGGVDVASARVLGGTSYVSLGNAVDPPRSVVDAWGIDLGMDLEKARTDLRVRPVPGGHMGEGTRRLRDAALQSGWNFAPMPKCIDFSRCKGCGQCMFGCPAGSKWTALDFVEDALAAGAVLHTGTAVTAVLKRHGHVCGVEARRNKKTFHISARRVILSAGALNTPRILAASGVRTSGSNLSVDVLQTTYGYTKDVGMQCELPMAAYFPDLLEQKGFFISPFTHVPYLIVRDMVGGFPREMRFLDKARFFSRSRNINADRIIGLMTKIRDAADGQVFADGGVSKTLSSQDQARLDEAFAMNREILICAGADPSKIFRGIAEGGHPCGTAALGRVVNRELETEIPGLFVCDASVFPTPLGVPPLLTIVALANRLSRQLMSE